MKLAKYVARIETLLNRLPQPVRAVILAYATPRLLLDSDTLHDLCLVWIYSTEGPPDRYVALKRSEFLSQVRTPQLRQALECALGSGWGAADHLEAYEWRRIRLQLRRVLHPFMQHSLLADTRVQLVRQYITCPLLAETDAAAAQAIKRIDKLLLPEQHVYSVAQLLGWACRLLDDVWRRNSLQLQVDGVTRSGAVAIRVHIHENTPRELDPVVLHAPEHDALDYVGPTGGPFWMT